MRYSSEPAAIYAYKINNVTQLDQILNNDFGVLQKQEMWREGDFKRNIYYIKHRPELGICILKNIYYTIHNCIEKILFTYI